MDPILIVDDEKDNLEALRRQLRTQYEVTTTESPLDALKLLQKSVFNVIISDQRMPEVSGVEFLEKAKNLCPDTTRVLLTGYTDIESVIDAINRGNVYRYVAKPWDPDDLALTVRQANEACLLRRLIDEKSKALQKTNEDLKNALDELQTLDRSKARFLSLVSHELNTPLTVLTSFVALISERRGSLPDDISKAIASMMKASDRFREIVDEVLTFVRMEADFRLELGPVDVKQGLKDALSELTDTIRDRQVTVRVTVQQPVVIRADGDKIGQAFRYLLRDALTRSRPGTAIEIIVGKEHDEAVVRLSRCGQKVSPEAFSPLEMSSEPLHHQQNLGLALAICRFIVEKHRAKMVLESSHDEQTVISIRFKD